MNYSYHDLALLRSPAAEVREAALAWLDDSRFRLDGKRASTVIRAVYPGWYGLGITDGQTSTRLEILLAEADGVTALSVHHHTNRWLIFCGAMLGRILQEEVESLLAHVAQSCPRADPE